MLEHVPEWLGRALKGVRAGADKLVIADASLGGAFAAIRLHSPAFADGGRIPERFTADGEGLSPPLLWDGVPDETQAIALIAEDPDAPALQPLVHAVAFGIDPGERALAEGAIGKGASFGVGRNSYGNDEWLPPDPPTGHGEHRYAFQIFALSAAIDPGDDPGRKALVKAMAGKVLAAGVLTGTYARGEPAPLQRGGAAVPAR